MPPRRRVLHVRRRDRDPPLLLLRRIVDRIETPHQHLRIQLVQHLRDRRCQRRLPMVYVPDRPDVHVRLATVKFLLRHMVLLRDSPEVPD